MKRTRRGFSILITVAGTALLLIGTASAVLAQDEDFRLPGPIPAPLRFVPSDQTARLDAETDVKRRAKLFLDLAEVRLTQAETYTGQQDFISAAMELGNYQGLIHNSIVFLQGQPNTDKTRDLFKNLEIALRTHCPRLEGIRRNTPMSYGHDVKDVIQFAEDSRDVSLSCFFGDTVLRAPEPANAAKPEQAPAKNP